MSQPAPGWYPDPSDPSRNIYWDGTAWSQPAVDQPQTNKSSPNKKTAVSIGVLILSAIGLFMTMQSVSLFSGTGSIWTGVAVIAAGAAMSYFLGAAKWARVIALVCLVFGLLNAFYIEKQMSDKRNEISQIFDN